MKNDNFSDEKCSVFDTSASDNVFTNNSTDGINFGIDSFLLIVIVLGNVLTILAILWARKLRNIISNYFILNLAVSDLLVGVTLLYNITIYVTDELHHNNTPLCISYIVILNLACGGSMIYLIVIAVDRYIAIVHPFCYNAYVTKKRALLVVIVAWTLVAAVSTIPIYWKCSVSSMHMCETILPR